MDNTATTNADKQAALELHICLQCSLREACLYIYCIWHREMLGFIPGKGTGAKAAHCEVQPTVCDAARSLVSSKYSVCGVWECEPSLCGAVWRKATGRSR